MLHLDMYRPLTPKEMMPGTMSQDLVSLLSAIGLLIAIHFIHRGSQRGWLVWLGLTGYLLYAYGIYAFDRVYTLFFPGYVAVFGLSLYALILFFFRVNLAEFRPESPSRLPRKTTGIYFLALVAMFCTIWMSLIIPGIRTHTAPAGNSIFVMDLAFFLPLLFTCAILLFRKSPFGDFLAGALLLKMGILGFSVFLGGLFAPFFSRELVVSELFVYAFLGLGSLALAGIFLCRLGPMKGRPELKKRV